MNQVYESNPWENVFVHKTVSDDAKRKMADYVKGYHDTNAKTKSVLVDLYMLGIWYWTTPKKRINKFIPDSQEIIESLGNVSEDIQLYIQQLCKNLGGQ